MANYFSTIYLYGLTLLKRTMRDPLTTIILVGIPVILLVIFGAFIGGMSDGDINVRTAVINNSQTEFAQDYEEALHETEVLQITGETSSVEEARESMADGNLDTVVELPEGFGQPNEVGVPTGELTIFVDETDAQTNELVGNIFAGIADEFNRELVGGDIPITVTSESVNVTEVQAIHQVFAIFVGLGLVMIGVLGISSVLPSDKKFQILRRLHVTPLRKSQVVLGTGVAFFVLGAAVALLLTLIALVMFEMTIAGEWWTLAGFTALGLISMVGLGLAVGGIAKNPTQGEAIGQVIFLASLALSGIWIPVALMPEFLQGIVAFMPLTPIIDGIRAIVVENAGFADLLPELAIIGIWTVVVYAVSFKTFRWE